MSKEKRFSAEEFSVFPVTGCEDTGNCAVFVDNDQVGKVPGDALRNDPLQGQTSSVVNVGVWDHCGQLLTEPHRPLQENHRHKCFKASFLTLMNEGEFCFEVKQQPLTHLGLSDVVMSTLGFVSPLKYAENSSVPSSNATWTPSRREI